MYDQSVNKAVLYLDERESVLLACAVQVLVRELGFDQEEVDRSYRESLAYFLKNDYLDQNFLGEPRLAGQTRAIA